jgi:16S rRNA C967 or C1407 C5-methylase (RsmB/RsmF family)
VSETTDVVTNVMSGRTDFSSVEVAPIIRRITNDAVSPNDAEAYVQLWPHINNTDAMFISIFERSAK